MKFMKILVTGSAGFIGSALTIKLLNLGYNVVGIDNHNEYYDINLKNARLQRHINNTNYRGFFLTSILVFPGISTLAVDELRC